MNVYDRAQAFVRKNSFTISFLIVSIFFLAITVSLPVEFMTNDDSAILTILKGTDGFPADPHTIFLNPITSHALYHLYTFFPAVPFYEISIYLVTFIAVFLILSIFLRSKSMTGMIISFPIIGLFVFIFFSYPSFTTATLMMYLALVLCILELALRKEKNVNLNRYAVVLVLCFFLALLLRWDFIVLFIIMGIPLLIYLNKHVIVLYKKILSFVIFLLIMNCIIIYLEHSQNSDFLEYNRLRSDFHDTYKGGVFGDITETAMKKAGWSIEDYYIFKKCWFIYDNEKFNQETLHVFLQENNPQIHPFVMLRTAFDNILNAIRYNFSFIMLIIVSLGCFLACSVMKGLHNDKPMQTSVFMIAITLILVMLMGYRFPDRVSLPTLFFYYGAGYLSLDNMRAPEGYMTRKSILTIIVKFIILSVMAYVVFCSCRIIHGYIDHMNNDFMEQQHVDKVFAEVVHDDVSSQKVILPYAPTNTNLMNEKYPFKAPNSYRNIKVLPYGWVINTPYYDNALRLLGFENGHELLKNLIDDKKFLIMTKLENETSIQDAKMLMLYFSRHIEPGQNIRLKTRSQGIGSKETGYYIFCNVESRDHKQ